MSDNRVDPNVKSYLKEFAESILERTGLPKLDDVQATHMLSLFGKNAKKKAVQNKQEQMGPGTSYAEAESQLGKDAKKKAVQNMQKQMGPGTSYSEAESQIGKNAMKGALLSVQKQMGPGTSYAEAKSEFANRGGDAASRKLDAKYNRNQEDKTTLQCYQCWKLRGVVTTKELPLHDTKTHSVGPLQGFPRVNQSGGKARCLQCKKHIKNSKHPYWVEQHRISEVTHCCSDPTCFNGRYVDSYGTLHDKCQTHYREDMGWK